MTDYEKVYDFQNLYNAHMKARLGKRKKADVFAFELNLAENLWEIRQRLAEGTYCASGYRNRSIASTHGHLQYGHTYYLRKKLYQETVFRRNNIRTGEEK